MTEELIERVARAMCSADPDIRMGDAEGVVQQRVNVEWPAYKQQARAALTAATPALMEQGARLMQEACANGLSAHAKALTDAKMAAKARKDRQAARDYESMAMACAFRATEIRALSPADIVKGVSQ